MVLDKPQRGRLGPGECVVFWLSLDQEGSLELRTQKRHKFNATKFSIIIVCGATIKYL